MLHCLSPDGNSCNDNAAAAMPPPAAGNAAAALDALLLD
jgi:hypothetical protein